MTELVTIEVNDGVADVRLNRPEKMNALSQELFAAISSAGDALAKRSDVRAVVLSGNGRAFCAGLDFGSFQGMTGGGAAPVQGGLTATVKEHPENNAQRPAMVWKRMPVPVIAAVHGVAFGGGLQIALGADIRIVAPDARLSIMEIKWGLIPDMALTQTLVDVVRLDIAKELTFSGRVVQGEEAVRLGLATRVEANPLAAALALAREIADKSPQAIRHGKRLLEESWRAPPGHGLPLEAQLQMDLIGKANQIEAVKANFENRPPRFSDA